MAYNNGFPMGYQYYQNYQNYYPPQQNSDLKWVTGLGGAKSYLVGPNCTVQLWDSEAPVIYLKSADASGMPSMKILDYTVREENKPITQPIGEKHEYAEKEYVDSLSAKIDAIQAEISRFKTSKETTTKEAKKA